MTPLNPEELERIKKMCGQILEDLKELTPEELRWVQPPLDFISITFIISPNKEALVEKTTEKWIPGVTGTKCCGPRPCGKCPTCLQIAQERLQKARDWLEKHKNFPCTWQTYKSVPLKLKLPTKK
jgi:hypothetical protein